VQAGVFAAAQRDANQLQAISFAPAPINSSTVRPLGAARPLRLGLVCGAQDASTSRSRRVLPPGTEADFRLTSALSGLDAAVDHFVLRLVDADVDSRARQVRARGTKAWTRDRIARVADCAWPFVAEHLATVLPGERVFRGLDRWMVGEAHRTRLRTLGLEGYRLHDARHHWAVRMARAGAPFELIARQLGHRDVAMVAKVYGRFKPDTEERDRWERIATARDEQKWRDSVARDVANAGDSIEKVHEEPPASDDAHEGYDDSRGGTRTRDPGIMSAVL